LLALVSVPLLALYLYGAQRQMTTVNTTMQVDQQGYMNYARELRASGYTYRGDRNRMPLYPALQSLFVRSGEAPWDSFARGRLVNIGLSVVLLGVIFAAARVYFGGYYAYNLTLVCAFLVFIFKAPYFQCELLFYTLNLISFLLMTRMLVRPTLPAALAGGVALALAYLTKASVLPGLLLFVVFFVVRVALGCPRRRRANPARLRALGLLAGFLALFLLVLSPYLLTSKRVYGRYFYNVNLTFYFWCDSWDEAERGPKAHGDRTGWPDLPREEIPSFAKYVREHDGSDVVERLGAGLRRLWRLTSAGYGWDRYLGVYLLYAAVMAVVARRRAWRLLRRYWLVLAFWAAFIGLYIVLYAWYVPIANGVRLILALFLPTVFVLSWLGVGLSRRVVIKGAGVGIPLLTVYNVAVTVLIALDIYAVLTYRIVNLHGGL